MKQEMASKHAAPAAAEKRADQRSPELGKLRASARKKSNDLARVALTREHTLGAVLAIEDGRNLELSRMLHDNVAQHVAALLLGLRCLEKDLTVSGDARLTLQSLHAIAQSIGHELHNIAVELRPTSLDDHGLARSLTTFLEEWSVMSKIPVDFDQVSLGTARLPRHIELALFEIVRNALRSILSAPGATHVSVILKRDEGDVSVIIEDLGTRRVAAGEQTSARDGGLAYVNGRAALLGGKLTVERRTGGGTTVFARLPLRAAAAVS